MRVLVLVLLLAGCAAPRAPPVDEAPPIAEPPAVDAAPDPDPPSGRAGSDSAACAPTPAAPIWNATLPGSPVGLAADAVRVYAATSHGLAVFSAAGGARTGGTATAGTTSVRDGEVVPQNRMLASDPNELEPVRLAGDRLLVKELTAWWAFERETGALAWQADHAGRAAPSPDASRLAVVDDEVVVLDMADGRVVWRAPWARLHPGVAAWSPDGATVYATWEAHATPHVRVAAFDATTGEPRWDVHRNVSGSTHVRAAHAVADAQRVVLVGGGRDPASGESRLVALAFDAADGALAWERAHPADRWAGRTYDLHVSLDDELRIAGVAAATAFGAVLAPDTGEVRSNWTRSIPFVSYAGFEADRILLARAMDLERTVVNATVLDAATGAPLLCTSQRDLPATGPIEIAAADGRRFLATWDERVAATRVVAYAP